MWSSASSAWRWSPAPAKVQAVSRVVVTSCALPASPGGELRARGDVLAVADRARGEREPRQAVVGIAGDQPLGERKAVGDVAVGERRGEGALDEIEIARIGAQRLARKDRRRRRCRDRRRRPSRRDNCPTGSGRSRPTAWRLVARGWRRRRRGRPRPPVASRARSRAARARIGETMSGTMRVPFRGAAARRGTEILY